MDRVVKICLEIWKIEVVPATGLEPVRCYSLEPESSASANSATRAQGDEPKRFRARRFAQERFHASPKWKF
jgi:hypothetical protein